MHNFNINIPSIPSKRILFKIQDNKLKGFTQKEGRFKDNLSYLQQHFIQSFSNLHPASPTSKQTDENRSGISTKMSSNQSSSFCRESQHNYRMLVPDNKKNLLMKYEEQYRHYLPTVKKDYSLHKGYSFGKSIRDTLDQQLKKHPSQKLDKSNGSRIIDNYFFNTEESEQEDQVEKIELEKRREEKLAKKMRVRKSAVFESEDRWKSLERQLNNKIKVGPGTYAVIEQKRKLERKKDRVTVPTMKLEKVMELLEDREEHLMHDRQQPNPQALNSSGKAAKRSSMFIEGNTDRFGEQIYPINPPLNVPGPGAYKYEDSLQDKANRILVLEEQRKLLKEWYNN